MTLRRLPFWTGPLLAAALPAPLVAAAELSPAQQAISALSPSSDAIEIEASLDRADGRYALGEAVTVTVRAPEDVYLYLFNIAEDGAVTLLYPNDYASSAPLKGGSRRAFPEAEDEWQIVTDREGVELVKIFATRKPRDFLAAGQWTAAGPFRTMSAQRGSAPGRLEVVLKEAGAGDWGSASLVVTSGASANSDRRPPLPLTAAELVPQSGPLDGLADELPPPPPVETSLY